MLADVLAGLGAGAGAASADLIAGLDPPDDAAVYRLTDELAVIGTVDFFPPLVDDPRTYGAIAAANACSDVFAMGGRVLFALSVAAFPEAMAPATMAAIVAEAPPRWSPRRAGRWRAATRSSIPSRSSGWP